MYKSVDHKIVVYILKQELSQKKKSTLGEHMTKYFEILLIKTKL